MEHREIRKGAETVELLPCMHGMRTMGQIGKVQTSERCGAPAVLQKGIGASTYPNTAPYKQPEIWYDIE